MTPSLASPIPTGADLPSLDPEAQEANCSASAADAWSQPAPTLTDDEREAAIKRAGAALIAAMGRKEAARRRYESSGCFQDAAAVDVADQDARRALEFMTALIRGRSADAARQMEIERGLL